MGVPLWQPKASTKKEPKAPLFKRRERVIAATLIDKSESPLVAASKQPDTR